MNFRSHILSIALSVSVLSSPAVMVCQAPAPASSSTASGQLAEPESNSQLVKKEAEGGTEAFRTSPSVIKLGGMLGMKPATASSVFEWLNFLVLAVAILYALAKALPKLFRGRTEGIQKNIVEARTATEQANLRLKAVEDRLSKLDAEIAEIRSDSERDAAEEEARVKWQIEEETRRIREAADQEIAAASSQAERSLRAYAAGIAVDRAASQLQISPDDDRALIQNFAVRLTEGSRN